ncbi:hypothetical protein LTR97_004642 [Elasticomyces elasticus]|uniref:Uncharacterized protein n=1 Tax=Elasticomyces elasticus TaxID=574655 RepID=A0AAN7WDN8_9PEZI|nr:hypothetical protein LTR97_004642 [Elasticomyces elasticus]
MPRKRPAPGQLGPSLSLIQSSGTAAGSYNERPFARGKHSGPHAIFSPTAAQHASTAITASMDETLIGNEHHRSTTNDKQNGDFPSSTTETLTATRARPRSMLASISLLGSHLSEVACSWNRVIFNKGSHTSSTRKEATESPVSSRSASEHTRTSNTPRSSKNHESQVKPSQVGIAAPRPGRPTTRSMTASRRSESSRRTSRRLAEKRRLEQTDLHDTVVGRPSNRHSRIIPKTEDAEEVKEVKPTGDEAGPCQLMMDARAEPAPGVKRKRMLRKITPNMNFMLPPPPTTGPKARRMKSNISEGAQQDEGVVGEEGGREGGAEMEGTGRTELGDVEEEGKET